MNSQEFDDLVATMRHEHPRWFLVEREPPVADSVLAEAEARLQTRFPKEYRDFTRRYGAGYFVFVVVYSPDLSSEFNIDRYNQHSGNLEAGFLAVSDNGVGDEYGFVLNQDGEYGQELWMKDHETADLLPTPYRNFFSYVATVGLRHDVQAGLNDCSS